MNDQLSGVTEGSSQLNTWPAAQMNPGRQEFESAETAERTMSGHGEHVEALIHVTVGETDNVSSYDMF